jgi:ankyrin repeat protein
LPDTLDETYDRTLEEIGKQNWEYAHRLFQCVAAASRPLRVEELAEFLAFDFDTDSIPTLLEDWREEDPAHAVRSTCSTLLAVVDVDGSSVIQFAHFSVKEYLTSKRLTESKETISRLHVSMTLAHTIIAQACLGVLLHIDENVDKVDLKTFPLAGYAAENLGGHARFEGVSSKIQDGMKRLFDPSNHHFSVWVWIYHPERCGARSDIYERPSQALATPLHFAAFYGLHDIVKFLIVERSQNINARGFNHDETPLSVTCRRGYPEVAQVLLEHGADTETRDDGACSPLDRSSDRGHEEVVRVLLKNHADVNSLDRFKWAALHWASHSGEVAAARVLLENGADANAKEHAGETPLYLARNEGVTRVLLDYGADPTARDNYRMTPLHSAVRKNHAGVARVLLENGVDANARGAMNCTPLHVASGVGSLECVLLLLQHSADIHARDDKGRTPFQVASAGGDEDVMQLLLEHGAQENGTQ